MDNWKQTGLTSLSGAVKIPATFTYGGINYKVSKLEDDLFAESGVTSVEIPDTVTEIGDRVFWCASFLNKEVKIPDSVVSIGDSVFEDCKAGITVILPDSVTSIGKNVFHGSSVVSVTLPSGLTYLNDGMFRGCQNIADLKIPNSVTSIGEKVFYGYLCDNKHKITWRGTTYTKSDDYGRPYTGDDSNPKYLEDAIRNSGN